MKDQEILTLQIICIKIMNSINLLTKLVIIVHINCIIKENIRNSQQCLDKTYQQWEVGI